MKNAYVPTIDPKTPIIVEQIEAPLEGSWERYEDAILFKFNPTATEDDIADIVMDCVSEIDGSKNYKQVFFWIMEVTEHIKEKLQKA
tara:strand:+ start:13469 stop:13729 length:261 start_codon:yes stop_codon:yes gene_type:complete